MKHNSTRHWILDRTLRILCLIWPLHCFGQWCPPPVPISPPWLSIPAEPYEHHWSSAAASASAHVYVMPMESGELGRPFVFVEGIDFGLDAENTALRNGNFGWQEFTGCNTEAYPMMAWMPVLLDSLIARGFTPVLVDFDDGTADLRVNAQLLADVIIHLRNHKTDPRPMVISGASMGGQLARIALKQLELNGESHCTELYISLDSPHQGSNVPLGLQQMIHFLASGSDNENLSELVQALHSPAARQLLLRQVPSLTPRINYQDELDALGWPTLCRNAAIANGSATSLPGGSSPLLDYEHAIIESELIGDIAPLFHLEIQPHPGISDHPLAEPGNPLTCHAQTPADGGFPWPLGCEIGFGSTSDLTGWGAGLDHLPGGTRPSLVQFVEAFNDAALSADLPWPFCIAPISSAEHQSLHSFIPTASALGIPPPWPSPPLASSFLDDNPFDAAHLGTGNEPHSEVNPSNILFLLDQLNLVSAPFLPGQLLIDSNVTAGQVWKLPGFTAQGRVGLQSCDPDFFPSNSPSNSQGEFRLQGCSGPLLIQENGILELGGETNNSTEISTAHLILEPHAAIDLRGLLMVFPGSQLELMPGAQLNLHSGQLHLHSDAQILIHEGALVTMNGQNLWTQSPFSTASLNGHIQMENHAHWQIELSSDARIETPSSLVIQGSPDASIQLHSPANEAQWILAEHATLHVSGLASWESEGCGIRMMGDGHLSMAVHDLNQWSSKWIGSATDTLDILGDLWLSNHESQGLILNHNDGRFNAHDCTFLWGEDHHNTSQINLSNNLFTGHPFRHTAPIESGPNVIQDCLFEQGDFGLESTGGVLRIESTGFEQLNVGLHSKSQRLEANCSQFRGCDIGILANRSMLVMTPEGGGGWNQFHDNDTHIRFIQALGLHCVDGHNHFGNWMSAWAQGTLSLTCTGMPINLDISGQSWNWPLGWQQIQGGLSTPSSDGQGCPIQAVDLYPVPPSDCREGENPKKE